MKNRTPHSSWLLALLLLAACGGGGDGDNPDTEETTSVQTATSELCTNIRGATAILWDLYNGCTRTDAGLPPPIPSPGEPFMHSRTPLLNFQYPAGYSATQIPGDQNTIGVDVIRDDGQVAWRYLQQLSFSPPSSSNQQLQNEIATWTNFFNLNDVPTETVCEVQGPAQNGLLTGTASGRLLRVGDHTMLIVTTNFPLDTLGCYGCASLFYNVAIAPTAEFEALAYNTFLAISWQLLRADPNSLSDRDNDGTPDIYDSAPDDPKVQ